MIRSSIGKFSRGSSKQASSTELAQSSENKAPVEKTSVQVEESTTIRTKVKQLVSEAADTSEDQKDEQSL